MGSDSSDPLWERFRNPINTLLPNQTLERGRFLVSQKSQANFTQGVYAFALSYLSYILSSPDPTCTLSMLLLFYAFELSYLSYILSSPDSTCQITLSMLLFYAFELSYPDSICQIVCCCCCTC